MSIKIINDDIIHWAENYAGDKFHSVLADPPYHLTNIVYDLSKTGSGNPRVRRAEKGFAGKTWDGGDIAFRSSTWEAIAHHLHPGGFGMAFASSRGWHRLACAIEDAGLIIHPTIFGWIRTNGFPKSTQVKDERFSGHRYGLQLLKPSVEPIIVFQNPYVGKTRDCILNTGAGTINIGDSRIGNASVGWGGNGSIGFSGGLESNEEGGRPAIGRWPSNLILEHSENCKRIREKNIGTEIIADWACSPECPVKALNIQSDSDVSHIFFQADWFDDVQEQIHSNSSFYFASKPSKGEREIGSDVISKLDLDKGKFNNNNTHPTLKPISLTRYLSKLLLPPEEYAPRRILVPFSGSGSEVIGAMLSGWEVVTGIERESEYAQIAESRINYWKKKIK